MKPEEAIEIIEREKSCIEKSTKGQCGINCGECKENVPIAYKMKSYDMAIEALKEVQQYREIGTVEECRGSGGETDGEEAQIELQASLFRESYIHLSKMWKLLFRRVCE